MDGRLDAVIIVGPDNRLPPRDWLVALFDKEDLESAKRGHLLRGPPPGGQKGAGAIVCSCFGVGINTLTEATRGQGLATPDAVGRLLNAGTNCGSCAPELRRLISDIQAKPVARNARPPRWAAPRFPRRIENRHGGRTTRSVYLWRSDGFLWVAG